MTEIPSFIFWLSVATVILWSMLLIPFLANILTVGGRPAARAIATVAILACIVPTLVDPETAHSTNATSTSARSDVFWVLGQAGVSLLGLAIVLNALRGRLVLSKPGGAFMVFWGLLLVVTYLEAQSIQFVLLMATLTLGASSVHGNSASEILPVVRNALRFVVGSTLVMWLLLGDVALRIGDGQPRELFGIGQLAGSTTHPNSLGFVAAVSLILEIATIARSAISYVAILSATTCVVFAQSRAGWVVAIAGLLVLWTMNAKAHSRILKTGALLAGLGVAGAVVAAEIQRQSLTVLTSGRNIIWEALVEVAWTAPGFGRGTEVLSLENRAHLGNRFALYVGEAHNQIIQTALETGLAGLLILCILSIFLFGAANNLDPGLRPAGYALLVAIAVEMLVESVIRPAPSAFMLVVVLALMFFSTSTSSPSPSPGPKATRARAGASTDQP